MPPLVSISFFEMSIFSCDTHRVLWGKKIKIKIISKKICQFLLSAIPLDWVVFYTTGL
jgi:hypothetical protein